MKTQSLFKMKTILIAMLTFIALLTLGILFNSNSITLQAHAYQSDGFAYYTRQNAMSANLSAQVENDTIEPFTMFPGMPELRDPLLLEFPDFDSISHPHLFRDSARLSYYWCDTYWWHDAYAFALGLTRVPDNWMVPPPHLMTAHLSWPGKLRDKNFFRRPFHPIYPWSTQYASAFLNTLSSLVKDDLRYLGNQIINHQILDTYNMADINTDHGTNHIAIRVADRENFHFMRWDDSNGGRWLHKPSTTSTKVQPTVWWSAVLEYRPQFNRAWVNEVYLRADESGSMVHVPGASKFTRHIHVISYQPKWQIEDGAVVGAYGNTPICMISNPYRIGTNQNISLIPSIPSRIIGTCGNLIDANITRIKSLGVQPNLNQLILPDNIRYVYADAFKNVPSLNRFTIRQNHPHFINNNDRMIVSRSRNTIDNVLPSAISGNSFSVPTIIGNVRITSIDISVFRNVSHLIYLTVPAAFTCIGVNIVSFPTNINIRWIDNFSVRGNAFVEYLGNSTIPYFITSIEPSAFRGTSITSMHIPNQVTFIGNNAFENTTNLRNLTFAPNSRLETIGNSAFRNSRLTGLDIPASVATIGNNSFESNTNLTSVTFAPNSLLRSIGNFAFRGTVLTRLEIPSSVVSIGNNAFENLMALRELTFAHDSQLRTIGNAAFRGTRITSLAVPNSVTSIGDSAFENTSVLRSLSFSVGSQLRTMGHFAFRNSRLESITIPNHVVEIGAVAFANNFYLATVNFNVTNMPNITPSALSGYPMRNIFYNAGTRGGGITVNIGANVVRIPGWLFNVHNEGFIRGEPNIRAIHFEEGSVLSSIGSYAFSADATRNGGLVNLTRVALPASLRNIETRAFWGADNITEIFFGATHISCWNIVSIGSENGALLSARVFLYSSRVPIVVSGQYYWRFVDGVPTPWDRTVRFDLNGGQGDNLTLSIEHGARIDPSIAPNPTKRYYEFRFWALSTNLSQAFNWNNPIVRDITLVAVWAYVGHDGFGGGAGTMANPWQIHTAEQLLNMANLINSGNSALSNAHFRLTANIQLNNTSNWQSWSASTPNLNHWTPIGTTQNPFSGTFNGNGFAIRGMFVVGDYCAGGLFGVLDGGTIINTRVQQSFVGGEVRFAGGLVGMALNSVVIVNNYFEGRVYGQVLAGGVIGWMVNGITNAAGMTIEFNYFLVRSGLRMAGVMYPDWDMSDWIIYDPGFVPAQLFVFLPFWMRHNRYFDSSRQLNQLIRINGEDWHDLDGAFMAGLLVG